MGHLWNNLLKAINREVMNMQINQTELMPEKDKALYEQQLLMNQINLTSVQYRVALNNQYISDIKVFCLNSVGFVIALAVAIGVAGYFGIFDK